MEIFTILISVLSLILAGISFWRTKKFQDYEFSPMLQISSERSQFSDSDIENSFALEYEAELENQGLKPVKVTHVKLRYGSGKEETKRHGYPLYGEIYIGPGKKIAFDQKVRWDDVSRVKKAYGIKECQFILKIGYEDIGGDMIEKTRRLGGYGESKNSFIIIDKGGNTVS